MKMKFVILSALSALIFSGCLGYSARENELTGQVKKVVSRTPIVCSDRVDTDISLGVMRNGVGSMSTEDQWFTVPNQADQELLRKASESGALVKVTYDVIRITWCWEDHVVTHVEFLQ